MKKSIKRTHPADSANSFVRNLLCNIGEVLGGFSDSDLKKTRKYFNNCCPYTGCKLTAKNSVLDHVIPLNRANCGLHLYGNIVPSSRQANDGKHSKNFEEFLLSDSEIFDGIDMKVRKERIEKIKEFQKQSGYLEKIDTMPNFEEFVQGKYKIVQQLASEVFQEFEIKYLTKDFPNLYNNALKNQLEENEIKRVRRKLPRWFSNQSQLNSQILIRYLNKVEGREFLDFNEFKECCSDIDRFDSHFSQMSKISKNNHGKVFDLMDTKLYLWEPVKKFIFEEQSKFI